MKQSTRSDTDNTPLAHTPLPRCIAIVRGARGAHRRQVYLDGERVASDTPVDLVLQLDQAMSSLSSELAIPLLAAFDLLMPERSPGPDASDDAIAAAWFAGCLDTAPGRTSLQMAHDILPAQAKDERRLLAWAMARAATLPMRPAVQPAVDVSATSPLQATGWQQRDPHELLDACLTFLQSTSNGTFSARSGQTEMAHAVLDALLQQASLVVEAGTGTGKTLAYALPAVLLAAQHDKRIVLSTHTRNLQQQLADRDLPWLWSRLGLHFIERGPDRHGLSYAKLLGRNNYVCRTALQSWLERQRGDGGSVLAAQILLGLLRSPDGTLEDVLPDLPPNVWAEICSRRGLCIGRRCKGDQPCPVYRVREESRAADIIVINHALLLADAQGGNNLLGSWDCLVVDEAHHIQRVATEALGYRLGRFPIEALARPLAPLESEAKALTAWPELARWGQRFLEWSSQQRRLQKQLLTWLRTLDAALPQRHRIPTRQRYLDGAEVFGCLGDQTHQLLDSLAAASQEGMQMVSSLQDAIVEQPQLAEAQEFLAVSVRLHQEVATALEFLVRGDNEDWAFYLDFAGEDSALAEIVGLPLDVSKRLTGLLRYDDIGVVHTSATLFVGEDSSWFRGQVGLDGQTRTLQVASPFDHATQCCLVQTANLGHWRDPDFVPQVAKLVAELHRRTRRRTMVLLTARHALKALHAVLRQQLGPSATILSQGLSGSRSRVAARFVDTPSAILLGLDSFWEGVDFPGEALELLVIPKLPFLVPDEPLVAARCQRLRSMGEEPFSAYILPEAVLRLRQGFGRLLRRPQDRGAVVLLDARLETREYGGEFLGPLPISSRVFEDSASLVEHVVEWLGEVAEPTTPREAAGPLPLDLFTLPEPGVPDTGD